MSVYEKLIGLTDPQEIIRVLRADAVADPGVSAGSEDAFSLGYLASYVAQLHREAASIECDIDEPRPLTDDEINDLLLTVSLAQLNRARDAKRRELADELCAFPGCAEDCAEDSLFCAHHTDYTDDDAALDAPRGDWS